METGGHWNIGSRGIDFMVLAMNGNIMKNNGQIVMYGSPEAAPQPAKPAVVGHGETRMNTGSGVENGNVIGGVDDQWGSEPVKVPSDLASRLRDADRPLLEQGKFSDVRALLREAADAIDAQAAEIAEAESQADRYRRASERWKKVAESAEERVRDQVAEIARLREALIKHESIPTAIEALEEQEDE